MEYRYYMTQRPAGPGCQPRDGLISVEGLDPKNVIPGIGGTAWSMLTYDRPLTDDEIREYELTPDTGKSFETVDEDEAEELFSWMYKGSWYTITGTGGDPNEWVKGYNKMLSQNGIGVPRRWVFFHGSDMNRVFCLTGSNRYPQGLGFLAFELAGLNIPKLAGFKMQMGDRWFDDIVDNNAAREENGNDQEDDE